MTGTEQSQARGRVDHAPARLLVVVLAVALVATLGALDASTASANELGERIGSARRGQSYYESVMLQADRAVAKLDRHRDQAKREMKRVYRKLKRARRQRADARAETHARRSRLERIQKQAPKEGEDVPKGYASRLREAEKLLDRADEATRRLEGKMTRIGRTYAAKHRKVKALKRSMRPLIGRREAAENSLAYLITSATRLAQQRAELKTATPLGQAGTFVWPTMGGINQHYGCTGYAANPRRGSCRHFHDGLDISPSGGTRIGTVATGVIAYAGWNPWDAEGRAFIVVVGHADGYVSRYGHLVPNRRVARAGQVVYRGQTVGYMGSTGNSTGVHLHVELLRNGSPVDPTSLMPDRGHDAKGKKDKKKGVKKKGPREAGEKKKAHDKHRKADGKRKGSHKREDRRDDRADERQDGDDASVVAPTEGGSEDGVTLETCEPGSTADDAEEAQDAPTLSDLAERLRDAADGCPTPVPGSAADPTWDEDASPWDLATLDAPRIAAAG